MSIFENWIIRFEIGTYLRGQDRWNYVKVFPDLWNSLYIKRKLGEDVDDDLTQKESHPLQTFLQVCWMDYDSEEEDDYGEPHLRIVNRYSKIEKIKIAPKIERMIEAHQNIFYHYVDSVTGTDEIELSAWWGARSNESNRTMVKKRIPDEKYYLNLKQTCGSNFFYELKGKTSIAHSSFGDILTAQAFITKHELIVMASLECIIDEQWFLPFSAKVVEAVDKFNSLDKESKSEGIKKLKRTYFKVNVKTKKRVIRENREWLKINFNQ